MAWTGRSQNTSRSRGRPASSSRRCLPGTASAGSGPAGHRCTSWRCARTPCQQRHQRLPHATSPPKKECAVYRAPMCRSSFATFSLSSPLRCTRLASVRRHEVDDLRELDDRRHVVAPPTTKQRDELAAFHAGRGASSPSRSNHRQLPTPGVTRPARLACHGKLPSG